MIYAVICALIPVIIEFISSIFSSYKFGDPETGFMMMGLGLIFWPIAFILFIIGIKRLIFNK